MVFKELVARVIFAFTVTFFTCYCFSSSGPDFIPFNYSFSKNFEHMNDPHALLKEILDRNTIVEHISSHVRDAYEYALVIALFYTAYTHVRSMRAQSFKSSLTPLLLLAPHAAVLAGLQCFVRHLRSQSSLLERTYSLVKEGE